MIARAAAKSCWCTKNLILRSLLFNIFICCIFLGGFFQNFYLRNICFSRYYVATFLNILMATQLLLLDIFALAFYLQIYNCFHLIINSRSHERRKCKTDLSYLINFFKHCRMRSVIISTLWDFQDQTKHICKAIKGFTMQ